MTKFVRWFSIISFLAFLSFPSHALAAQKIPVGITLSPLLQQIQIQAGDVAKSFDVTVTNNTGTVQEISLSARDFGSLNDTGGLIFEGAKNNYSQKYGLASWLSVSQDTVVLNPHESKTLLASIENRSSLQPGGHYGAVVASVGNLDSQSPDAVVINQQLVALVLVTKVGGEHYDLRLKQVTHNGNWLHLPSTVILRFQNPGNVHVIPRGLVELKSPSGTVMARGVINVDSAIVLPESFRTLPVDLTPVGKAFPWPGQYHLSVQYRYDGLDRFAAKNIGLQFVNAGMGVLLVVILAAAFWTVKQRVKNREKPAVKSNK
ncbi:MAG: exported protein of unknown function [Candidatus Saccharibacteria bacterium]|nr:exported protein of unknown function [Candidatus Saccharibacteria bacterium]